MDLDKQFLEQNLYSNWLRNVLITLLVAFTFYNSVKIPNIYLKTITIFILLFAIGIIIINLYLTYKVNSIENTYHYGLYNYVAIILIIFIIVFIASIAYSD